MLHKPKVGMNERMLFVDHGAINVEHHTRIYTHMHTYTHTGINVRTRPSAFFFFLNKKRPKEIRVKKKKRSKFFTYYSIRVDI